MEIHISVPSISRLLYVCILCLSEVSKPLFFPGRKEASNLMEFDMDVNRAIQGAPVSIVDAESESTCHLLYKVIEVHEPDPMLFTYPKCVKVKKCQGCCVSKQMSCQPTSTRIKRFRINHFRYTKTQTEVVKSETLSLEEHLSCDCDCEKKPEDCSVNQVYERNTCDCTCKNANKAKLCSNPKKIWDKRSCQCICRKMMQCNNNYVFDPIECRCKYVGLKAFN